MNTTASSLQAELDLAKDRLKRAEDEAARKTAETHNVYVQFTFGGGVAGDPCTPSSGFNDITAGTPVRVTNDEGKLIGSASLGTGTVQSGKCQFSVRMPDVLVADAKFLSAEVGRRGAVPKSASELARDMWTFYVTLG